MAAKKKIQPPSPPTRQPPVRKTRADAQRNRELILDAAKHVFTRDGAAASLDEIARLAGIGPGTLYRHFPNRDALIETVYRTEVEKLAAAAPRFAANLSPLEALRAWMNLFIDHVAGKMLIVPAMETVTGGSSRLIMGSKSQIHGAFLSLAQRAVDTGYLRPDIDPNDLMRALVGIFHTTYDPGWELTARRLVDILLAGSRA
jgi:AcrR family transcriptional regulator